jgi:signal transduction protein with GAF and PtsI domain
MEEMGVEMIGRIALSWLGVPLTVGDQVLGVMAVQSHTARRAYDEHDRDLLTAIAGPVAIAIQNARLFQETQRRAEQEQTINELMAQVRGSIAMDAVARRMAAELGKALGATRVTLHLGPKDGSEAVNER